MGDGRYDEDHAERRKQAPKRRRKKGRKQQAKAVEGSRPATTQAGATPTQEEDSTQ